MEKIEQLFKSVYGEMIDTKYSELHEKEIVRIALNAVIIFSLRFNVDIKEMFNAEILKVSNNQ